MAYDIYGERLASGHCEVHPHVAESYPCSLCYSESNQKQGYDRQQKEMYDRMEAEYYAQMERAHYEDIAKKNNWLYHMLCSVASWVSNFNDWLQKYKEKKFNKVMQKCYRA